MQDGSDEPPPGTGCSQINSPNVCICRLCRSSGADELELQDRDVKSHIFGTAEARGTERRSGARGTGGHKRQRSAGKGVWWGPPRTCHRGDAAFPGIDWGKRCVNDGWPQAAAEAPGSTLNQAEKCVEVETESKGMRLDPARGWLRTARRPSAAAPKPELIFSFGLCQVVQGAKEDEGRRPMRWLRAGAVPKARAPA